jgi:hypothetical protein
MIKQIMQGQFEEGDMDRASESFEAYAFLEDIIEARKNAPIDERERLSIEAMIAYRAYFMGIPEWIVRESLMVLYDIEIVCEMRRRDFVSAVEYLVDLKASVN